MRSRVPLFGFLFAIGSFILPLAAHAGIPFFGPIIPPSYNVCPAGWGMIMDVINNIISLLLTLAIVFVAPLMIAYSGFLFVVNPVNAGGKEQAKKILTNTVVGIVIALAGWMIVDAVMAVLTPNGKPFGQNWASLITSSGGTSSCLVQRGSLPGDPLNQATLTGVSASGGSVTISGQSTAQCSSSNTACSPTALQAAGFSPTEAEVMSCIAVTENSGNATGCNGNACGTFQIMLTINQLVGSACGGTLNCPALCKGNDGAAVETASCQPCVQAANDPKCNAQAARSLFLQQDYKPWTVGNVNSAACIQQYAGG